MKHVTNLSIRHVGAQNRLMQNKNIKMAQCSFSFLFVSCSLMWSTAVFPLTLSQKSCRPSSLVYDLFEPSVTLKK